jgi:hypothetical protein
MPVLDWLDFGRQQPLPSRISADRASKTISHVLDLRWQLHDTSVLRVWRRSYVNRHQPWFRQMHFNAILSAFTDNNEVSIARAVSQYI